MKTLFKIFLAAILIFGLEKLIRTQTHGFRIEKTQSDYLNRPEWEISPTPISFEVLNQPFYFLGSGVQSYVFIGKDQCTILKFFKHYHFGLSSTILKKIPLPNFARNWRDQLLKKREKRMESIFSSAMIALQDLPERTGVEFLNINPKKDLFPTIHIYDNLKIPYKLNLNKTPFLIQKKADLIFPYLKEHPDQAKKIVDSFFSCIIDRAKLGISNKDTLVYRNFGVSEGVVIEIDIGSFVKNPSVSKSLFSKRELFHETKGLKEWIQKYSPELNEYFEQKLLQAIRT